MKRINVKDYCFHLNPFDNYNLLIAKKLNYDIDNYPCQDFVDKVRTVCVRSDGNPESSIMIIGQNPGLTEDEKDLPFVGRSGIYLFSIIERYFGIKREDVYITNVMKCFLETEAIRKSHLKFCCSLILERELSLVRPKKVLILGEKALEGFLFICKELKSISDFERGKVYKISIPHLNLVDVEFLFTFHPSFICRNNNFEKQFIEHLSYFFVEKNNDGNIEILKSDEEVRNVLFPVLEEVISKDEPIVLDLETKSIECNDKNNEILCMGFAFKNNKAIVLLLKEYDKLSRKFIELISEETFLELLDNYLSRMKLIGHNLKFDLMVLWKLYRRNFQKNIFGDTIILHHLLKENPPHDLKTLAKQYTRYGKYEDSVSSLMKLHKKDWWIYIDYEELAKYCGYDCLATYELYQVLLEKLDYQDNLIRTKNLEQHKRIEFNKQINKRMPIFNYRVLNLNTLYQFQVKHYKILFEMERNGLPFDLEYINSVKNELLIKIKDLEKELLKLSNLEVPINWNSSQQVRKLFVNLGLISPIKTSKGELSYNEEALKYFANEGVELAKKLLEYRAYQKALNTYISIPEDYSYIMENTDSENIKRLSCKIKIHGTETGRLSTSDPSFHTIPRDNLYRRMVRAEKGWFIVSADYSMADLRMIAGYSGCISMIRDFESGKDFHSIQASKIFKKNIEDISKEERAIAKNINFAIAYLSSPQGIAKSLNIPVSLAQNYIEEWYNDKQEVRMWINNIRWYYDSFLEGEEVLFYNLFGRCRRVTKVNFKTPNNKNNPEYMHIVREVINFFPQSTVADTLMIALIKLKKAILENKLSDSVKILLTIHDALLLEVRQEVIEDVIKLVKEVMEFLIPFPFYPMKIPVEVTYGEKWEKN